MQHNAGMRLPRPSWLTYWAADPAVRVGVAGASWSIAGSFARGLLPRSPLDQAVATSATATINFQLSATAWATLEALAAKPGQRPGTRAMLAVAGTAAVAGFAAARLSRRPALDSMTAAAVHAVGRRLAFVGLAGASAALSDYALERRLNVTPGIDTTLVPSVLTGAAVAGWSLWSRAQRAQRYGLVDPERHTIQGTTSRSLAQATAVGIGSTIGLTGLMVGEQFAARSLKHGLDRAVRIETGAIGSLLAHSTVLAALGGFGVYGLGKITARIQRRGDVVEPAYPAPPSNRHVSAGPTSAMPFDALGKEGRRFVLMALTAEAISQVMGEPAVAPVRVVAGYESATDIQDRAALALADLEACGAFERQLICVAAPTGVGYVNYTYAEALEYLTRGNCATVVPQYALVPSALALSRMHEGELLTRMVLEGIRERIATMPAEGRPRVVVFGESLGAAVALDVATLPGPSVGIPALDHLGVSAGLYLGVPFLTEFWRRWREYAPALDPQQRVVLVSQPDETPQVAGGCHLMVVHHDDPVNKFGFAMVLQPPWWMGPAKTRPPLVPRETKFRPFTTFIITTVDLKNGMQSRPGAFVRRGHDYRIEARLALQRAYDLNCSPAQAEAIEQALRAREQEWAARRMVARTMARARQKIESTLESWGSPQIIADVDPVSGEQGRLERLISFSGPPGS